MSTQQKSGPFDAGHDRVGGGGGGIGGRLRAEPEDFLVEEIPLYEPSGEGEHAYLFVEKRNMSTLDLLDVIRRHFGVDRRAVGHAGLKDKRAITRQLVSVHLPGKPLDGFPSLRHEQVAVLWADRHVNKLRPGHLRGNRFSIRVRGVGFDAALAAQRTLARLAREGLPNRFGGQRFGVLGNNHRIGRAIVLGDWEEAVRELLGPNSGTPEVQPEGRELFAEGRYREALEHFPRSLRAERSVLRALAAGKPPRDAIRSIDRSAMQFYASAFQSAVFNGVLSEREAAGGLGTLVVGDLAFMHSSGATFLVSADELADPAIPERLGRFEISPSGPMWGVTMRKASGEPGRVELAALESAGVAESDLRSFVEGGGRLDGARRPLRVPVLDPDVEGGVDERGSYVRCAFELPRGSFATTVMDEIMGKAGDPEESDVGA